MTNINLTVSLPPLPFISSSVLTLVISSIEIWENAAHAAGVLTLRVCPALHVRAVREGMLIGNGRQPRCSRGRHGIGCLPYVNSSTRLFPTSLTHLLLGKPFRESGPPQNMAQLIMLRHKVSHLLPHIYPHLTSSISFRPARVGARVCRICDSHRAASVSHQVGREQRNGCDFVKRSARVITDPLPCFCHALSPLVLLYNLTPLFSGSASLFFFIPLIHLLC